ncbi:uncharacterized protein LOC111347839 [Spodoptera litura]|uniref:Uncharacterized protein LOC111347839 n=1 Tax=Spodoptera litura TaxID=69820 RepID=A0A9J7DNW4_SPOLT|nr:uncharacterized protein LOC111347839 [Spodoptera litura]
MKVILLFSFLAVASSYPIVKTWTLTELSTAIETKQVGPDMMPYLEAALNEIMYGLFTGKTDSIHAAIPSPTGADTWTVQELKQALKDSSVRPEYRPALLQAQAFVERKNETGELEEPVQVLIPALDIATWSESDLLEALNNPSTKEELRPFLEKAFNDLRDAQEEGETRNIVYTVTPVGMIPPKSDYDFLLKPSKRLIKKTKKGL